MKPPRGPGRPPRLGSVHSSLELFYFVTFNTAGRRPLLANDVVHDAFLGFCRKAAIQHIGVGRYVLMPDHAHLFLFLPPDVRLATWMGSCRRTLGRALDSLGNKGPYWQPGFFDHLMRSAESYAAKWEYVRQNPVRAKLATAPDLWPYQGEIMRIEF